MERIFQILAVILIGIAAFFFVERLDRRSVCVSRSRSSLFLFECSLSGEGKIENSGNTGRK